MNQLKRYEDLPFQKKLFFVFGFSLVFCIVVAVFVLTDYCTRILVNNNIDNLTVISQQAGIDFIGHNLYFDNIKAKINIFTYCIDNNIIPSGILKHKTHPVF